MPPKISNADQRLMAAYQEAALRIQRLLEQAKNPGQRATILRRIDSLLAELDQLTATYLGEQIPIKYKEGSEEAISNLKKLRGFSDKIDATFGTIHTEAVKKLAEDAALRFSTSLEGVRRSARSTLSRIEKQEILGELIASEIEGAADPAGRIQEVLEEQGVTALQGSTRTWTLESYSSMLTRTLLGEAHNAGANARYAQNGIEYVRVIEQSTSCPVCSPMRDKVVWLGDPRLSPIYHPNCKGGTAPVFGVPENPIKSIDDPRIPAETRKAMMRK